MDFPLLMRIEEPADLRRLARTELPQLARELRGFLLDSVSRSGGHLGAGLGTVELSIALHYVFNTPDDRLVWDIGHQAYPHKILTGRREQLCSIRKRDGLSGFLKRSESRFDSFGAGHSSTSVSAALGMAAAAAQRGESHTTVAVIGDGAMTAGLAYEALNHAGTMQDLDLLVVLNDNRMSISPNVGALSNYLSRILSGRFYSTLRQGGEKVLRHMPPMWDLARRAERHAKGMLVPGTLFEELGFNYFGPIDGHDLPSLLTMLGNLRELHGPRLLHVTTVKGRGYAPAEADPVKYHGVSAFDPAKGLAAAKKVASPTYTQVFGDWLCDEAQRDPQLAGVTPAMREGSGLVRFAETYPERYFDVGIAEQHALTFAAGLACGGMKPVVAIYSTFLQRAYDQLIHDIMLQQLPVLFAIDRAGVVGPDGATHAGSYDLSYLRCLPGVVVMCPSDENECRQMLHTGYLLEGPAAVRYPRGTGTGAALEKRFQRLPIGLGEIRRGGRDIALLAFGVVLQATLEAAEALDATVANMRFVKPLDEELVLDLAARHQLLVTIEENVVEGGAGSAVSECLRQHGSAVPVAHLGLPDRPLAHGTREQQLHDAGLDTAGILQAVRRAYARADGSRHRLRSVGIAPA